MNTTDKSATDSRTVASALRGRCNHCKCEREFIYEGIGYCGEERHRCKACGFLYVVDILGEFFSK